MNTHPRLLTHRERTLAETLTSLSPAPVSPDIEPPKHLARRLVLCALLVGLVSAAALSVLVDRPDPTADVNEVTSTSTDADPRRGTERSSAHRPAPAVREITGSGFVVAPGTTTVFSKYEGRITGVGVEAGEVVAQGQALVTLDDAGARFALEQARVATSAAILELAARRIDLSQAHAALARMKALAARAATSRQRLEEAQAAFDRASNGQAQARQSVESAELSIRIARERLEELTVRAPFAGTVTRLDARIGDTVLARADSVRESQSLLTITDMTRMVIDADVAESTVAALEAGRRGEAVLDGFPDRPFAIAVLRLAPVASAEKGTITLRLTLDHPPDGIRPNMAARIRIPLDHTGDTTP